MKFIVYVLLAAIVASLGTGLYYLRGDSADSAKMLRALQVRVALSAALILILVAAYFLGWLTTPTR